MHPSCMYNTTAYYGLKGCRSWVLEASNASNLLLLLLHHCFGLRHLGTAQGGTAFHRTLRLACHQWRGLGRPKDTGRTLKDTGLKSLTSRKMCIVIIFCQRDTLYNGCQWAMAWPMFANQEALSVKICPPRCPLRHGRVQLQQLVLK